MSFWNNLKIEESITFFIFLLGLFTVFLSVMVAVRFKSYKAYLSGEAAILSRAISWQLWGEAIIGLGTLFFSTAAYFGFLKGISVEFQSLIRFLMFFSTSATTYHLLATLRRL